MGRTLKRVPLNFDWPLETVWCGYEGTGFTSYGCLNSKPVVDPPKGDGFQLWETTSKGSPVSPVFETLDKLCEWCESNCTVFADIKISKEQWKEMLDNDFVHAKVGKVVVI